MHERDDDRASRRRHTALNDGELLDIGPNAETIDEAAAAEREERTREEVERPADEPRKSPRFGSAGSGGLEYEPGPERP